MAKLNPKRPSRAEAPRAKPTPSTRDVRDVREVFAELIAGPIALTRSASPQALAAVREHSDEWRVFYILVHALRRDSPTGRRLVRELLATVDRQHASIVSRRARFASTLERAGRVYHGIGVPADPHRAIDAVGALLDIERQHEGIGEFSEWPLDDIRRALESMTATALEPEAKQRNIGRGDRGGDAAAALLSRKFRLFGDSEAESNDKVVDAFGTARRKHNKADSKKSA